MSVLTTIAFLLTAAGPASALVLKPDDIAFVRAGTGEVCLARSNGAYVGRIANAGDQGVDQYDNAALRWSPDGLHLAYLSSPNADYRGDSKIKVVDPVRNSSYSLSSESGWSRGRFAWAASGKAIYFWYDIAGEPTVPEEWMSGSAPGGSTLFDSSNNADTVWDFVRDMDVLPDGRLLAVIHRYNLLENHDPNKGGSYLRVYSPYEVAIMNRAGAVLRSAPMSPLGLQGVSGIRVSPDSTKAVFSGSESGASSSIYLWDFKTNSVKRLYSTGASFDELPCFASGGRTIVWSRGQAMGDIPDDKNPALQDGQVWTMGVDGSSPHLLIGGAVSADVRGHVGEVPVLLVHGIDDSHALWLSWVDGFGGDPIAVGNGFSLFRTTSPLFQNIPVYAVDYHGDSNAHGDIPEMSRAIPWAVDRIGSPKVFVIAHSLGGLLVRDYMENLASPAPPGRRYQGDVAELLTLDTPYGGSSVAESHPLLATFLGLPAAQQMFPLSSVISQMNSTSLPPGNTRYGVVVGNHFPYFGDGLLAPEEQIPYGSGMSANPWVSYVDAVHNEDFLPWHKGSIGMWVIPELTRLDAMTMWGKTRIPVVQTGAAKDQAALEYKLLKGK